MQKNDLGVWQISKNVVEDRGENSKKDRESGRGSRHKQENKNGAKEDRKKMRTLIDR